jgi:hypothetical protein
LQQNGRAPPAGALLFSTLPVRAGFPRLLGILGQRTIGILGDK